MTSLSLAASERLNTGLYRPQNYDRPQNFEREEDPFPLSGKHVVVVEDEGIIQMQIGKCLRRLGMKIVGTANNGEEGIALCLKERPEIVLMDVNLPGTINGLEAAKQILSQYHPCLIVLTAYSEYAEEARNIGSCGYIVKPIDNVTLRHQLRAAYQLHQVGQH